LEAAVAELLPLYSAEGKVHFSRSSIMVFDRRNLDFICGRGILALLLGMLVFAPLAFGAVDTWAWLTLQAMTAGMAVLWAARLWLHPRPKLLWPPLNWVVLAFVGYALFEYFTADIEYIVRREILQVLVFALVFFAVVTNFRKQEDAEPVVAALIAVGTFSAGYAVVQLTRHSHMVWNQLSPYLDRAGGPYICPNHLAGLLGMLLPLALAYLLVGKVHIITRVLLGYGALMMAAGLAVTFSRAGYLAAGAGVALLLLTLLGHGNHRGKAAVLLLVMLALGIGGTSHFLSKDIGFMRRIASPDDDTTKSLVDTSAESRLRIWAAAVQMWRDHPVEGVGPGGFDYRFREYRPVDIQSRPDRVHNDYLNLLADWGVVGGGIVLAGTALWLVWLRKTWPQVRREENVFGSGQSNRFALFLGASCGLAALAVHSAMDFNLHIPANALVAVVLLALLTVQTRHVTEDFLRRLSRPAGVGLTLVLAGAAGFFVWQTVRLGGEAVWLNRADAQEIYSPPRRAALEKAFAFEPKNFQTAYDIGECWRLQGQNLDDDAAVQTALAWFARAAALNPHDGYSRLRTGMCLDRLGRTQESRPYYQQAELLDPNGYFMVANIGWHFVQTGDYAAAREWFQRSEQLGGVGGNPIASKYLDICNDRLRQQASGQRPLLPGY
jgi:O-antigen ligase